jgi:hypothetical protein
MIGQIEMFGAPPTWPDGWTTGTASPHSFGMFTGHQVVHEHRSGAKVSVFHAGIGGVTRCYQVQALVTADEWWTADGNEHWLGTWSWLGAVMAGDDLGRQWAYLIERTGPAWPSEDCPSVYGQWLFIRELLEHLAGTLLAN